MATKQPSKIVPRNAAAKKAPARKTTRNVARAPRGLSFDGMPLKVFEASVDPQQTILGDARGVVFAVHCVAPEQRDPGYSGALRGVFPNHITFEQYGTGQRTSRTTAVVSSLDETPKWTTGKAASDTGGNRTDLTPGCYVLCKLTRQPKSGDVTTAVKLYRNR